MTSQSSVNTISVVTYNARGLRNRVKRRALFRHIQHAYANSVIIMQETHSTPAIEDAWRNEWQERIMFSHGSESGQSGVAIMFPHGFSTSIEHIFSDDEGRIVCSWIGDNDEKLLCIGIYAPASDDQRIKCAFLDRIRDILMAYSDVKTLLCGDLNIKLGPLDSDKLRYTGTRASIKLEDLLNEFALNDVWRTEHESSRKYTWRRLNPIQQSRID